MGIKPVQVTSNISLHVLRHIQGVKGLVHLDVLQTGGDELLQGDDSIMVQIHLLKSKDDKYLRSRRTKNLESCLCSSVNYLIICLTLQSLTIRVAHQVIYLSSISIIINTTIWCLTAPVTSLTSDLDSTPSLFTSYTWKVHLNLSSRDPFSRIDRPIAKSCGKFK